MILINDKKVDIAYFPDGTLDLHVDIPAAPEDGERVARIVWLFESEAETAALYHITNHLHDHGVEDVRLDMPYLPNARMDRVQTDSDVFTLKYFARLINSLGFTEVSAFDVHSAASGEYIERFASRDASENIAEAIRRCDRGELLLFFPDEGAMKRYSHFAEKADSKYHPVCFGEKTRDWRTREITGLRVCGQTELLCGSDVLMIDDICSSGKTLLKAALILKKYEAKRISLYVSHCENIAADSELFRGDLIEKVFTTRSFFRLDNPKFEYLPY